MVQTNQGLDYDIYYIKGMMIIKYFCLWIVLFFSYSFCFGQKVITLTKQNGVYTIPCSINGVKRSLVFDTGASTVTISKTLAYFLYNSGKLKDADIKGFGQSQTASGHIVNNMAIVLRDIEISGFHLKNVDAVIIDGQNVPLLLGLSAIKKLGKITLSGNKLLIDSPVLTTPQLKQLRLQIRKLIDDEKYQEAISLLKKIEIQEALDETDLFQLAMCYSSSHDNDKALMYSQQWIGLYEGTKSPLEADACYITAMAYKGLGSYHLADQWFAKAIKLVSTETINNTNNIEANTLSYYYNQKALNYLDGKAYDLCVEAFDISVQYRMRVIGVTPEDLCAGLVNDKLIGSTLLSISKIYAYFLHNDKSAEKYAILSALCGNQEAIDFCNHFKLDYRIHN